MTLALYELTDAHRELFARIEEADGEIDAALEAELDALSDSLGARMDACCARLAEWSRSAVAVGAEIDRLKARQQSYTRAGERLKRYVQGCLERAEIPRVETDRFTVRVQASPPSARWTGDPEEIPEAYRREKLVTEFNGRAAIDDFRAGIELPEGVEVRQSRHLVIR